MYWNNSKRSRRNPRLFVEYQKCNHCGGRGLVYSGVCYACKGEGVIAKRQNPCIACAAPLFLRNPTPDPNIVDQLLGIHSAAWRVADEEDVDPYIDGVLIAKVARDLGVSVKDLTPALLYGMRNNKFILARADLIGEDDPRDIEASEIRHLGATFHIIRLVPRKRDHNGQ